MRGLPILFGMGCLTLALLVSAGASQDAKKDDKKETKTKGFLPAGFKDLGLTAEQKSKIYALQADYKAKLAELKKQSDELKKTENAEVFKVLTDAQREQYLKNKGVDTKKDKAPDKKDGDKKAGS